MNKLQKRTKRTFGLLACEWCGKWTSVWKYVSQSDRNLKKWHDDFEGNLLQCKRSKCILSRPEDWSEIKYLDLKAEERKRNKK